MLYAVMGTRQFRFHHKDFNFEDQKTRAAFSKVPRKILGKLLILGATDTQVATSCRGYSATVEHCTNRPISSVQRSNRKLCSSSSSNSSSKIRSFPKIFPGTFENAALGPRLTQ